MKKFLIFLLAGLSFTACKSKTNNSNKEDINISLIASGNLHGAGSENIEKQNLVIENKIDWTNLLAKMDGTNNISNSFEETDIDFSEYSVIAVFDEVKSSGGHSIDLNVKRNTDKIIVEVIKNAPSGMATTVITQPFYLAKIKKNNLPIEFK